MCGTKLCVTKLCVCVKDGVTKRARKQGPVATFCPGRTVKWKLPQPLRYRMTRNIHSSKGRERKVGVDVEDFPSLQLGVGEDVDEVEKLVGIANRNRMCIRKHAPMRASKRWLNWY